MSHLKQSTARSTDTPFTLRSSSKVEAQVSGHTENSAKDFFSSPKKKTEHSSCRKKEKTQYQQNKIDQNESGITTAGQ